MLDFGVIKLQHSCKILKLLSVCITLDKKSNLSLSENLVALKICFTTLNLTKTLSGCAE